MTDQAMTGCFTLLKNMPHGNEQRWTDELRPLYSLVLAGLSDEIGKKAVEFAVLSEDWRPSPARLRQIAARIACPYPDDDCAYAEIIHKAASIGMYGKPVTGKPACFVEGPPPMSHPIVAQIVAYCGGWKMICNGEANMQEGLKKQVRGAHESVAREWEYEAGRQSALPPSQRNPIYVRRYPAYVIPAGWTPDVIDAVPALPPREVPIGLPDSMPEEVRRMIPRIGK